MTPKIILIKRTSSEEIDIKSILYTTRKTIPALEELFRQEWDDLTSKHNAEKKVLWDSTIYRLDSVTEQQSRLSISLDTIPFSIRKGMNAHIKEIIERGEEYYSKAMYSSIFVRTIDGQYVFGLKKDLSTDAEKLFFIGGAYSKEEHEISNGVDFFYSATKEVSEELNVEVNDIKQSYLLGMFINSKTHICVVYEVMLNLTSEQLLGKFETREDKELDKLVIVPLEEIKPLFEQQSPEDLIKYEILKEV